VKGNEKFTDLKKRPKKFKFLPQARSSFASLGNRAPTSPSYNKIHKNRHKNGKKIVKKNARTRRKTKRQKI
jgi:hypothetical protein